MPDEPAQNDHDAKPTDTAPTDTAPTGDGRTKRSRARTAPITGEERERIRQLAREGGSVRGIAKQVGRSPTTVSRVAGDLIGERRGQTAAANAARSVDFGAERSKLMEQSIRASRLAMQRFAQVGTGDHRGSLDEARAFQAFIASYARLDDRHARAQGGQGMSDVDAYLAWMHEGVDPTLLPDDDEGSP